MCEKCVQGLSREYKTYNGSEVHMMDYWDSVNNTFDTSKWEKTWGEWQPVFVDLRLIGTFLPVENENEN